MSPNPESKEFQIIVRGENRLREIASAGSVFIKGADTTASLNLDDGVRTHEDLVIQDVIKKADGILPIHGRPIELDRDNKIAEPQDAVLKKEDSIDGPNSCAIKNKDGSFAEEVKIVNDNIRTFAK